MDEKANAVNRDTHLRDIGRLSRLPPTIVRRDTELAELNLAQRPFSHTVAVVDDEHRLVGIIPLVVLVEQMFLRLIPGEFLSELGDAGRMAELGHLSLARRAEDVMSKPVSVTLDTTLGEAFAAMRLNRLLGLPLVDEERRVVGDVDLIQLLRVWQERHGMASPPGRVT